MRDPLNPISQRQMADRDKQHVDLCQQVLSGESSDPGEKKNGTS